MNFNSLSFLIFLPITVFLYWVLPHRFRWIMLLIASYFFYMSWNVWLGFLMFVTCLVAYLCSLLISRTEKKKVKKLGLAIAVVFCLGVLIFFKYINFLLENLTGVIRLFGGEIDDISLNILLPVGISFYTFQTLSYVIDVYRGDFEAEKHFGYFALFVSFFPQLVAGPIERPGKLLPQLKEERKFRKEYFTEGMEFLLIGFFRKCVIADMCGVFVNHVFADLSQANALSVTLAALLFFVQIYCDFAGYSEIAMGSARLMGMSLSRNFNKPLLSASYTEFFRRWHITLNQWFTQYVYIPLGGNRKGKARKILNTLIVFTLCGLWHGANWTYVFWGLYAGIMVSLESVLLPRISAVFQRKNVDFEGKTVRFFRIFIVYLFMIPSLLLFRAQSIGEFCEAFGKIFTAFGFGNGYFESSFESLGMNGLQFMFVGVSLFAMSRLNNLYPDWEKAGVSRELTETEASRRTLTFLFMAVCVALCWIALLSDNSLSDFTYFQF